MRRAGGAIAALIGGLLGSATGDPAGFTILAGMGVALGNLNGRGAWRLTARRLAGRLDRLISTVSGEALRNGTLLPTPPTSLPAEPAAAPRGEREAAPR